jgi:hypothetical protein
VLMAACHLHDVALLKELNDRHLSQDDDTVADMMNANRS